MWFPFGFPLNQGEKCTLKLRCGLVSFCVTPLLFIFGAALAKVKRLSAKQATVFLATLFWRGVPPPPLFFPGQPKSCASLLSVETHGVVPRLPRAISQKHGGSEIEDGREAGPRAV